MATEQKIFLFTRFLPRRRCRRHRRQHIHSREAHDNGEFVLVLAVGLNRYFFSKG